MNFENEIISVVASGHCLKNLNKENITKINDTKLFRCNWFFNDNDTGIKKDLEGYFFIVKDQNLLSALDKSTTHTIQTYYTPLLNVEYTPIVNYWEVLKEKDDFYKQFLNPKGQRNILGDVGLPTTGVSMFAFATSLQPKEIIYAGIDFYKPNKDRENFDYLGHKDSGVNPYLNEGSTHSLEADMKVFMKGVLQYKHPDNITIYGSDFVVALKDFILDNRKINFEDLYKKVEKFYMEY